jgi:uncharacterized protein (TIGR02466 family)
MNIMPLFMAGVGRADASKFLPFARDLFVKEKSQLKPVKNINAPLDPEFTTTLDWYLPGSTKATAYLVSTKEGKELINFLVDNSILFLDGLGFDVSRYNFQLSAFWINEMTSGTYHQKHSHFGKIVSGTFYVDMPVNSAGITYYNPMVISRYELDNKTYSNFNSSSWTLNPKEGEVYFWESNISHEVRQAEFKGIRRSIAFDVTIVAKKD